MKRILSITGIMALAFLFTSAISFRLTPQDPPQKKKKEKHIKMVRVSDDGKKMELDTIIDSDEILIWNGDTINSSKKMKWVSKEDFDMDFDFDIDVEDDGNGNVFIMKSGKNGDGEEDVNIMKWHSKGDNDMIFNAPHGAHKMMIIGDHKKGNVIDLSDPGIISFDKKELKNGKEKIVIIREKPSAEDVEIHEEIIMHGSGSQPMIIHESHPGKKMQVKVFTDDEGNVEIIEDGKVWDIKKSDKDVQVIEEDGKKIIIKKIKKGDKMEVEVEVEKKEEHEEK
jgi:hypothetical protein